MSRSSLLNIADDARLGWNSRNWNPVQFTFKKWDGQVFCCCPLSSAYLVNNPLTPEDELPRPIELCQWAQDAYKLTQLEVDGFVCGFDEDFTSPNESTEFRMGFIIGQDLAKEVFVGKEAGI